MTNKTEKIFTNRNYFFSHRWGNEEDSQDGNSMTKGERYFPSFSSSASSIKKRERFQYLLNPSISSILSLSKKRGRDENSHSQKSIFLESSFLPVPVINHDSIDQQLLHPSSSNSTSSSFPSSSNAQYYSTLALELSKYYNHNYQNQLSLLGKGNQSFQNEENDSTAASVAVVTSSSFSLPSSSSIPDLAFIFEYLLSLPILSFVQEISNGNNLLFHYKFNSIFQFMNHFELSFFYESSMTSLSSSSFAFSSFSSSGLSRRQLKWKNENYQFVLEKRLSIVKQLLQQMKDYHDNHFVSSMSSSTFSSVLLSSASFSWKMILLVDLYCKYLYSYHSSSYSYSSSSSTSTAATQKKNDPLQIIEETISQYSSFSFSLSCQYLFIYSFRSYDLMNYSKYSLFLYDHLQQFSEKIKNYLLLQEIQKSIFLSSSSSSSISAAPILSLSMSSEGKKKEDPKKEKEEIAYQVAAMIIDQLSLFSTCEWNSYHYHEKVIAFFQAYIMLMFPHNLWNCSAETNSAADGGVSRSLEERLSLLEKYWEEEGIRIGEVPSLDLFQKKEENTEKDSISSSMMILIDSINDSYSPYQTQLPITTYEEIFPFHASEMAISSVDALEKQQEEKRIAERKSTEKEKEQQPVEAIEIEKDKDSGAQFVYSRIHGYKIWILPEDDSRNVYKKILSEIDGIDEEQEDSEDGNEEDDTNDKKEEVKTVKPSSITKEKKSSSSSLSLSSIRYDRNDKYLQSYYRDYYNNLLQIFPLRSLPLGSSSDSSSASSSAIDSGLLDLLLQQVEDQPERVIFFSDLLPSLSLFSSSFSSLSLASSSSSSILFQERLQIRMILHLLSTIGVSFSFQESSCSPLSSYQTYEESLKTSNFNSSSDMNYLMNKLTLETNNKRSISTFSSFLLILQDVKTSNSQPFNFHSSLLLKQNYQLLAYQTYQRQSKKQQQSPEEKNPLSLLIFFERILEFLLLYYYHERRTPVGSSVSAMGTLLFSSFYFFEFISQCKNLLISIFYQQYQWDLEMLESIKGVIGLDREEEILARREQCKQSLHQNCQRIIQLSVENPIIPSSLSSCDPSTFLVRQKQQQQETKMSIVGDLSNWSFYLFQELTVDYCNAVKVRLSLCVFFSVMSFFRFVS
jgi:hypothetical protein